MLAPTSTLVVRNRLCLKSTLNKNNEINYNSKDNSPIFTKNNKDHNQVSNTVDTKDEDSLDDFRSPKKIEMKVKNFKTNKRLKWVHPIRHFSYCNQSTQKIILKTLKKPKSDNTGYSSENEFQVFRDRKKKELLEQNKYSISNSFVEYQRSTDSISKNLKQETIVSCTHKEEQFPKVNCAITIIPPFKKINSDTHRPGTKAFERQANPLLIDCEKPDSKMSKSTKIDYILSSEIKSVSKVKSLQRGFQNMKINNIIIPDSDPSDDEDIDNSQKPADRNSKNLKTMNQVEDTVINNISLNSLETCDTSKNSISSKIGAIRLDSNPSEDKVIESSQKSMIRNSQKLKSMYQVKDTIINNISLTNLETCESFKNNISAEIGSKLNESLPELKYGINLASFGLEELKGKQYVIPIQIYVPIIVLPLDEKKKIETISNTKKTTVCDVSLEQESNTFDAKSLLNLQDSNTNYENSQKGIDKAIAKCNKCTNPTPHVPTIVQASHSGMHIFHPAKDVIEDPSPDTSIGTHKITIASKRSSRIRPRKLKYVYVRKLWWIGRFVRRKQALPVAASESVDVVKLRPK